MVAADAVFLRVDHPAYVVSDLDHAIEFFTEVLGASVIRTGEMSDPHGHLMRGIFGVHPRARMRFGFVELGGLAIELLEWHDPEGRTNHAGNSDLAGRHLAIAVADLGQALERVRVVPGVVVRERSPRGFVYISTPFGLEIQLVP